MSVAVEQAGIDYHVVLAQNALQQCLDQPELESEFICALIKQTSRHTQHRLGVQVKKAARLVSLGTARVVSPAYCLTTKTTLLIHLVPFLKLKRYQSSIIHRNSNESHLSFPYMPLIRLPIVIFLIS